MTQFSKFKIILFGAVFFVSFLLWQNAEAATYYVKNGGNDEAAGTSEAPWATIAKVAATATNGDTIYFDNESTWSGATPVLTATAGVKYYGTGYGNGTRATFTATSATGFNLGIIRIAASSVEVKGFNLNGAGLAVYGIDACSYSIPASFSNVTIQNNYIHNIGGVRGIYIGSQTGSIMVSNINVLDNILVGSATSSGIVVYPQWGGWSDKVDTITIRNNTISNFPTEGIYIKDWVENIIVEFNTISACGSGVHFEESEYAGDETIKNATVRYNILYGNTNTGIDFKPRGYLMTPIYIYGNLIYNNGVGSTGSGYGIYVAGADYGGARNSASSSIYIYNNTITQLSMSAVDYMRGQAISIGAYGAGTEPTNLKLYLSINIIYAHQTPYQAVYQSAHSDGSFIFSHSYNLIYSDSTPYGPENTIRFGTRVYSNAQVTDYEATAVGTAPAFTGGILPTGFTGTYGTNMVPNTDYFQLTNDSPAKDNGETLGSPFNGSINGAGLATPLLRPQGSGYDIGAYEFNDSVSEDTTPPASPTGLLVN